MKDELVFVALGSNLGRARETLCRAMDLLQELSLRPLLRSCLYVTAPVDCPPGSPDFLNAVVGLAAHPEETPESMIGRLQALEKEFGRQPKLVLNEPRPLDLDLIVFGSEVRPGPALILPHPRAHERRFVLQPLSEIAPELVLPGQTCTVAQLLENLPADAAMRRVD
jgi:2-amino-4-hydroxy-6-hydroxymethyldihydropteridine diphosphokinase